MFKYVQNRNTRANCEICSRFIRTSLEHIRISQRVLGIHLELWISIFKQGYSLTSYEFTLFSFAEIVQLEIYVGSFKYPANIYLLKLNRHARTSCGMYSAFSNKTPESWFFRYFFHWVIVGNVLFLTLLGILVSLMLLRTGQLFSLSQSKLECVGLSNSIWRWNYWRFN